MSAGKARLTAAAIVVVAWLGFLMVLAFTAGKPTVVSRPQFLVADVYVVAELQDGAKNKPPPLHPPAMLPNPPARLRTGWRWKR